MQMHAAEEARTFYCLHFPHTSDDGWIHLKQGESCLRLSSSQKLTPRLEVQLALKVSKERLADLKQGSPTF